MSKVTNKLLDNVAKLRESLDRLSKSNEKLTNARIGLEKAQRDKINMINERMRHINIKKWIEKNGRK
ncbi:low affinity Fe/Cu permease [Paenibacillus jamilae]|nr:low affinity Fe/Cu permease [Paenibacillus jamilae]